METDKGKFEFRPYTIEDEGQMVSLWETVFNKKMPIELWRWKYHNNPYGIRMMLCVDEKGGIAAMFGGIPFPIKWNDRTAEMTHLMDNMSHPEFRGGGYFVRTITAFIEAFCGPERSVFLYGFPGKFHFEIGNKYHLYKELAGGVTYLYAKPSDIAIKTDHGHFFKLDIGENADFTIFDTIWNNVKSAYAYSVIRDGKFAKWRFSSHPFFKYDIWGYEMDGKIQAYAAVTIHKGKARIIDMVSAEAAVKPLIGILAGELDEKGVEMMETWLPKGHFIEREAFFLGMSTKEEPIGFIPTGRTFTDDLDFDWAAREIYYTMADGDLF